MTREEHIIYAQNLRVALRMMNCFSAETMESLDMAIKALEKEPILDKIRAEIAMYEDADVSTHYVMTAVDKEEEYGDMKCDEMRGENI